MPDSLGPLPLALSDHLRSAYAAWGVRASLADDESPLTEARLTDMLSDAEPRLAAGDWRVYASSFDADSPFLRALPRNKAPAWPTLERLARTRGARSAMLRLPHFWQLEPAAHAACKNAGAPLFVSEPENVPVGAAATASLNIDLLVIDAAETAQFSAYLLEKNVACPRTWLLVQRPGPLIAPPSALSASGATIAHEVHALPGLPVLEQCPFLAAQSALRLHGAPEYLLEGTAEGTCATSLGNDPFPLRRFFMPLRLRRAGACPCGRDIYEA